MHSSRADIVIKSKNDSDKAFAILQNKTPCLILYHANWCRHCHDFIGRYYEPSRPWQQICDMVKTTYKGKIVCIEVEESNMTFLPKEYSQIRGFPTLMIAQPQQAGGAVSMIEYMGARDSLDAVKTFIEENTGIKGGAGKKRARAPSTKATGGATSNKAVASKAAKKGDNKKAPTRKKTA